MSTAAEEEDCLVSILCSFAESYHSPAASSAPNIDWNCNQFLSCFSEQYFNSNQFRHAIIKVIELYYYGSGRPPTLSTACSSLIRQMLLSIVRVMGTDEDLSLRCDCRSVYHSFRKLILTQEEKEVEAPAWPMDERRLPQQISSLAQVLDRNIAKQWAEDEKSQAKPAEDENEETIVFPLPSQQTAMTSHASPPPQKAFVSIHTPEGLLIFMLNFIARTLLARAYRNNRHPVPINFEEVPGDLLRETRESEDSSNTKSDPVTTIDEQVKKSKKQSFCLRLHQLYSAAWDDTALLNLIHRLKMQDSFGLIANTESNRLRLSGTFTRFGLSEEDRTFGFQPTQVNDTKAEMRRTSPYFTTTDPTDTTEWLIPRWMIVSTHSSVDGKKFGSLMTDTWRFKVQRCYSSESPEDEKLISLYAQATDRDGNETPVRLADHDDLHSEFRHKFADGAKQMQEDIDRMWWNDETLIHKYATEAASGTLSDMNVGGHPLLTQSLHVQLCNIYGKKQDIAAAVCAFWTCKCTE